MKPLEQAHGREVRAGVYRSTPQKSRFVMYRSAILIHAAAPHICMPTRCCLDGQVHVRQRGTAHQPLLVDRRAQQVDGLHQLLDGVVKLTPRDAGSPPGPCHTRTGSRSRDTRVRMIHSSAPRARLRAPARRILVCVARIEPRRSGSSRVPSSKSLGNRTRGRRSRRGKSFTNVRVLERVDAQRVDEAAAMSGMSRS